MAWWSARRGTACRGVLTLAVLLMLLLLPRSGRVLIDLLRACAVLRTEPASE